MSYDVSFKAKLEGVDQRVYVGADWISHASSADALIKEVCGSYPSEWTGRKCADMYPVIMQGISLLNLNPQRYRPFEAGYSTVESVIEFLWKIADNCDKYPTAVFEVNT